MRRPGLYCDLAGGRRAADEVWKSGVEGAGSFFLSGSKIFFLGPEKMRNTEPIFDQGSPGDVTFQL